MALIKKQSGDGEIFKFEGPGSSITGVYVNRRPYQGDYAPTFVHTLKTEAGLKAFFGTTVLNDLLTEGDVGKLIRVTQTKSRPSKKGNPTKMFEVEVDDEYQMDASELGTYDVGESDIDGDDAVDEIDPPRAAAPRQPAAVGASQASKAQALLGGNRRTG